VPGNQGACDIATSYEIKATGLTTGEPVWDAGPKCPEARQEPHAVHPPAVVAGDLLRAVAVLEYVALKTNRTSHAANPVLLAALGHTSL
jgi:hypothetical protein